MHGIERDVSLLKNRLQQAWVVSRDRPLRLHTTERRVIDEEQEIDLLLLELREPVRLIQFRAALPGELKIDALGASELRRPWLVLRMDRDIDDSIGELRSKEWIDEGVAGIGNRRWPGRRQLGQAIPGFP